MQNNAKTTKRPRARGKASLEDILGNPNGNHKTHHRWAAEQRLLTELRERFSGDMTVRSESAKAEIPTFSEHMADAATDSYDRDWALAMLSSDQNALYEIEQALNRMAAGTYGICEVTGQVIERERLRALPWTRFSAAAQAELEQRGLGGRTQLGQLGSYAKTAELESAANDEEELALAVTEKQAA